MTPDIVFSSLSIIMSCFFLALIITAAVKRVLIDRAVLDIPNDRSSHKIPVPRGGGWALLAVLVPGLIGAAIFLDNDMRHGGLILAVLLLAGISWLDDRRHVSARLRLSLHILAACLGSFSFPPDQMLFGGALPFWLDRVAMILGWAWFINLYNFMDGIDGITGVETISIATGLCVVMAAAGISDPFVEFLTLIITGVCLGFLAHNWHPAKIFLGDVGSVPLGYLIGFCLLSLAIKGYWVAAFILPLYYLADSGITITKRALRGEKIWEAHRQHFYQHAAVSAGRHDIVVFYIMTANFGLILAAVFSVSHPVVGLAGSVLIVAGLLGKMRQRKILHSPRNG
jgi:UDP-N-acetylmuramyl pentapeptide phosphotransferase/UDP-N-acetylglucosamine-1-phosphate transferase